MFPETHRYVTCIGNSYGGPETWQFGIRLSNTLDSNLDVANALFTPFRNWWMGDVPPYSTGAAFFPVSTQRLTELKVARLDMDGEYLPTEASASHFYVPALAGPGVPFQGYPPQATIAVTLLTNLPRGYASKGRIFLPHNRNMDLAADGRMDIAGAKALADSTKNLIKAINLAGVGEVRVYSRGKGVPTSDTADGKVTYTYPDVGAQNAVTSVRCGRVVDTQRRRRRALVEAPVVTTVV